MAEDSDQNSQETARARYSRAFRPLSCWLVISACLLAWNYHQKDAPLTTVKFTVRIEGKTIGDSSVYAAEVGSQRVASGSVAPIGWHNFKVVVPDTNPFEKRVFIWYGENEVGDIGLEWNRGVLDLKIEPAAKFVRLVGPHHGFLLTNSSGEKVSIPVGRYQVGTVFNHISEQHTVEVGRNETNSLLIKPSLGAVRIMSEPAGAKFRLSDGEVRNPINMEGEVPALLTGLPVRQYQLHVWRGDYTKQTSLEVKKWETNNVNVAFEYGEVKVASEPEGATIFSGNKDLGQTPKTLTELKPGPFKLRLEKEGFTSAEMSVEVLGTNLITITTKLAQRPIRGGNGERAS